MKEQRNCPACGGKFNFEREVGSFEKINNKKLRIEKCNFCGIRKNSTLFNFEKEEYEKLGRSDNNIKIREGSYDNYFIYARETLRQILNYKKSGDFIDLGCGIGHTVKLAKVHGFNARGVDLNKSKIELGKKELDLENIFVKDVSKIRSNNKFDVVVMNAFLEHVKDLNKFVSIGKGLLKKGGILSIEVPRFNTPIRKVLRKRWNPYAPHEHYWYFTKKSCKMLLEEKNELEILEMKTTTNDYLGSKIPRIRFFSYRLEDFLGNITNLGDKLSIIAQKN